MKASPALLRPAPRSDRADFPCSCSSFINSARRLPPPARRCIPRIADRFSENRLPFRKVAPALGMRPDQPQADQPAFAHPASPCSTPRGSRKSATRGPRSAQGRLAGAVSQPPARRQTSPQPNDVPLPVAIPRAISDTRKASPRLSPADASEASSPPLVPRRLVPSPRHLHPTI